MKVIIAGGRDVRLTHNDYRKLDGLKITEVVSGACPTGIDADGEAYARSREIPVKRFPAHWDAHGRAAGPMRNKEMAQYAEAVALFPGGKGTRSMHSEAKKADIIIYDFRS